MPVTFEDGVLGKCEYFTVRRHNIDGKESFFTNDDSFASVTCIAGNGKINGEEISSGDTFFIPASFGTYEIEGSLDIIETKV